MKADDQPSLTNEEMTGTAYVTVLKVINEENVAGDLLTRLKEGSSVNGNCHLEKSQPIKSVFQSDYVEEIPKDGVAVPENLDLFKMAENITISKFEIKNEELDITYPSDNFVEDFDLKTSGFADMTNVTAGYSANGDYQLKKCQLVKTELKSDYIEEIPKHGVALHESFNLFKGSENVVCSKYEIKSEEMDITYPSMQFDEDLDLKGCNAFAQISSKRNSKQMKPKSNFDYNSKETEKQKLSTRAWNFKSDVTERKEHFSFNCFHCDYSTNTRKYLVNHMSVHNKGKGKTYNEEMTFSCDLCTFNKVTSCKMHFQSRRALDNHIIKNHKNFTDSVSSEIYNCQTCDYKTTRKNNLRLHKIRVHSENNRKHSCKCCDKQFSEKRYLDNHIIQNHQNFVDLVKNKVHNCQTCDYRTTIKRNLRSHRIRAHAENDEKHSCRYCEKQFTEKKYLDDHIIQNHQNFVDLVSSKVHNCQICDYRTTVKNSLKRHMINIHSVNYEKQSCTCCKMRFRNKWDLDSHIVKYHKNFIDSVSGKVHSCQTCGYKTKKKDNLRRHMIKVHSENDKKHSCACCEKQFMEKIYLDDHIIQNHQHFVDLVTNIVHSCQTCDYRTTIKRSLRRHRIKIHAESDEKHSCRCCGKQFTEKRYLDDHIIQNHHNFVELVNNTVHNCKTCGYRTTIKRNLTRHMLRVHAKNEEKHLCKCCGQQFTETKCLDDHIIQNHQNFVDLVSSKVHNCETCDYRTTIKRNLRRHRIRVHAENDEKLSCKCCKKQFTEKKNLDDHIIQNHQHLVDFVSSKVHNCQTCDYKTTLKGNLKRHNCTSSKF